MKYIRQLGIILLISFLGELLHYLLPLPVPGEHLRDRSALHGAGNASFEGGRYS